MISIARRFRFLVWPTQRMRYTVLLVVPMLLAALTGTGCGREGRADRRDRTDGKIRATVTTGMVADTVRRVGGDRVEVTALMGPGVDPHLYKASEGDIALLARADIIFYNGLHLEGKMGEIFRKMARSGKPTVPVAEALPPSLLLEPSAAMTQGAPVGQYDPHVWFDVSLWARTIPTVVEELAKLQPAHRAEFEANGKRYQRELEALHAECRARLATIPRPRRVLVTAHDAFGYFGRAYDVEVLGLQGISTASEYGLKDVQRIVELLVKRKIPAVFVESSVPRRSIEAVIAGCRARGHRVRLGGMLFSDAMGEPATPEGTYPGMVRHNVSTIVSALS